MCLTRSGYPFALALTLAFSAKESLFKALFPTARRYMGFDFSRVTALNQKTIALTLSHPAGRYQQENAIASRQHVNGEVYTLIVDQE